MAEIAEAQGAGTEIGASGASISYAKPATGMDPAARDATLTHPTEAAFKTQFGAQQLRAEHTAGHACGSLIRARS